MRPIFNPWDGSIVGEVPIHTLEDAQKAVARAADTQDVLRRIPSYQRYEALSHVARRIKEERESFARLICAEAGKPIRDARGEVDRAVLTFSLAANEARQIGGEVLPLDMNAASTGRIGLTRCFPAGVVAGITPFNFPLNLVAHKVAPAMAAGCPIVLKPAEKTPLSALKLAELIAETSWPDGGLTVLTPETPQEVGTFLASAAVVNILSFTGSDRVGWHLKSLDAKKRHVLELGGNAAVIVCADADLDYAVNRCVLGAFAYSGQICLSVQRLFVEDSIFAEFRRKLVEKVESLKVGDPASEETDLGPVISEEAAQKIETVLDSAISAGAEALIRRQRKKNLLTPTVLVNTSSSMDVEQIELFGPALCLRSFREFDEALSFVNEGRYGLQAGVFTRDLERIWKAHEELHVGGVIVNDSSNYRVDNMPYGGVKESGLGREGIRWTIGEYTEERLLALTKPL